jgi:hypothetical protein
MRNLVPTVVLAVSAAACGASVLPPVEGSGRVVTLPVAIQESLTGVRAEGALTVEIASGVAPSVVVEADDNLVPLVRTEVTEGVLRVWTDRGWTSKHPLVVRVGAKAVSAVSASGTARVRVDALRGESVEAVAHGTAHVEVGEVAAKKVKGDARGASWLKVAGRGVEVLTLLAGDSATVEAAVECDDVSISAQGAAQVSGPKAKTARVTAAGAPSVDLDASQTLRVDASGAANVRYGGKPEIGGVAGVGTTVKPR